MRVCTSICPFHLLSAENKAPKDVGMHLKVPAWGFRGGAAPFFIFPKAGKTFH
jgi:hypothetical protein